VSIADEAFEHCAWRWRPRNPASTRIPVYEASLPCVTALLPYLASIDENRWYSTRGPLVCEFERRLSALVGARAYAVTAASGTSALEAAVLATAGRATSLRPLALMPAYTFVATAMAAERCGYIPYFLDITRDDWSLDAERLVNQPALAHAGVVIPVAPYGRALEQAKWRDFVAATGIPVVIDGAAAFESLVADPARFAGDVPVTLSFQATKAFSTAEGGAVAWSNVDGLTRVLQALNFGLLGTHESASSGTNGKMSEYHAALGLAALDALAEKHSRNVCMTEAYRAAATARDIADRIVVAPSIASNYVLFVGTSDAQTHRVVDELERNAIETRRWYGRGLHHEPYFTTAARGDALEVTDEIASRTIGLPAFERLTPKQVATIVGCIADVVGGRVRSS
jgi:dTDP-4-amino-4,6-dideoxygalactose transaminase